MRKHEWTAILANRHQSEDAALDEAERAYSVKAEDVEVVGVGISCGVGYVVFSSPAKTQTEARNAFIKAIRSKKITAYVPFVFKDKLHLK